MASWAAGHRGRRSSVAPRRTAPDRHGQHRQQWRLHPGPAGDRRPARQHDRPDPQGARRRPGLLSPPAQHGDAPALAVLPGPFHRAARLGRYHPATVRFHRLGRPPATHRPRRCPVGRPRRLWPRSSGRRRGGADRHRLTPGRRAGRSRRRPTAWRTRGSAVPPARGRDRTAACGARPRPNGCAPRPRPAPIRRRHRPSPAAGRGRPPRSSPAPAWAAARRASAAGETPPPPSAPAHPTRWAGSARAPSNCRRWIRRAWLSALRRKPVRACASGRPHGCAAWPPAAPRAARRPR